MADIAQVERILKATANRRRLAILKYLTKRPGAKVGDIAAEIKLSFKSTSKHLAVLLGADLVEREQLSLEMHYKLRGPTHSILKTILSIL
ncbi:MAG: ArsR family transcriptional regulator [Patescibacteria group bacterium]